MVIIDDEALVRIGLKSMINWEEQDCEIIGEASNGQIGLELIEDKCPDIVIMDIKMPVMDGFQMMDKVLKGNNKAKFIVLSSYDEFELVREAMKLGIEEYIIKLELEPQGLINILTRIKDKITLQDKRQAEEYKMEKHIRSNKYAMREEFFKKIVGKVIFDKIEIDEELEYLDIRLEQNNTICANVRINDTEKLEKYREEDINLLEFSIVNVLDEIVNDTLTGYTFNWSSKEFVIVCSHDNSLRKDLFKKKVGEMTERIMTMLKQYFNISVSIGFSNTHDGIGELSTAYMESSVAVKHSFYVGSEKAVFYSEVEFIHSDEDSSFDIYEITNGLRTYIEMGDIEAIEIIFDNIIEATSKEKSAREKAYDLCGCIAFLIKGSSEKDRVGFQSIFQNDKTVFEKVLKLNSLQDIELWLRSVERELCTFLTQKDGVQNNRIVSKAKKYISKNFAASINLQEVAADINISPGYFSKIFKQVTGMSFIDYVTEMKINEAKRLLVEGNYKIYEISEKIGYENAYYFSKVFKKITGMTPSEFEIKKN